MDAETLDREKFLWDLATKILMVLTVLIWYSSGWYCQNRLGSVVESTMSD